ncbi:MAG: hypothetical protein K6F92_08065 [Lachnospiraceae bacterium]|nr:hypothetical protein [Lachnospiraceae bacterium]
MITFDKIPLYLQNLYIIILMIIATLMLILVLMEVFWYFKTFALTVTLLLFGIMAVDIIGKLLLVRRQYEHLELNGFLLHLECTPIYLHLLLLGMELIYLLIAAFIGYWIWKHQFSLNSIREAFAKLPTGVCFASDTGDVLLSNNAANRFVWNVLGCELLNITPVWERLRQIENEQQLSNQQSLNSIKIMLEDYTVKEINRKIIRVDNKRFVEIIVSDVTSLYNLSEEVKNNNENLQNIRNELKELSKNLVKINHEEEVVRHKIRIHNDVGNTILATRNVLNSENCSRSDLLNISAQWRNLAEKLIGMNGETSEENSIQFKEILDTAEQVGVKVTLHGDFKSFDEHAFIVRQVLRETLINAIRHGQADEMDIYVNDYFDRTELRITNNGTIPENFNESGGLKNLREGLVREGGTLSFETDKIFTTIINFKK